MGLQLHGVTVDCHRPLSLARFWAAALGWPVPEYGEKELAWLREQGVDDPEDDPAVPLFAPDRSGPRLLFLAVPEGKTVKNRMHLDVRPTTSMREEVERLTSLGASVVVEVSDWGQTWTVMRDPEGNEFCVERAKGET